MDDTIDLLQIKIENAKRTLPEDTLKAISAVPWQAELLKMRETTGYSFEQLGDLELETELVLCGLLAPQDYPKELENRMKITRAQANELVEEMNKSVFAKIREELIRNTERPARSAFSAADAGGKKEFEGNKYDTEEEKKIHAQILGAHGIEIIPDLPAVPSAQLMQAGKLELTGEVPPILAQKLSGSFQVPTIKTEHTLENITRTNTPSPASAKDKPKIDPYREIPE